MFVYTLQDIIGLCALGFICLLGLIIGVLSLVAKLLPEYKDKIQSKDKRIF